MNAMQAIEWLMMDAGVPRPDAPTSNGEALARALDLPDEAEGHALLQGVLYAVQKVERHPVRMVAKAFVFGARLGRFAADADKIGDPS